MAAAASSSSAAADDDTVAGLPQPPAMSSSSRGRPTSPQDLLPLLISKAARSNPTRRALIAQIANGPFTQQQLQLDHNKESITRTVTQGVKKQIDAQLVAKGLKDIVSLSADLTSLDVLLDLVYFIDTSGELAGWEPIIRVAKHQGRGGGQLPIELTSADVEAVGSRAVYDSRCEALRQLSLIGRHIGMTLGRDDGEERLNGLRLTIRPLQTLPADHPFRDGYDPANPVCEYHGSEFPSIRDAVLFEMRWGGSEVVYQDGNRWHNAPIYDRLRQLASQESPIWGCHTTSTRHWAAADFRRIIVLHGDQPGHHVEAHIAISSSPIYAIAYLYTTKPPVDGKEGAARFRWMARREPPGSPRQ
ncbi:unnamed protein product [Vitrella brassicaformis CCMP3155]|uniref:Uncharacterized protein n=1 Tax=Vitrella brassicaformis (strain CCMP3155) TaxID=1169540 RepID=A0A0G4FDC7_VITBC|nr:unnamed protein product [Vitrella brassicaformis CCMP3155]|eukprot:CEM10915.1 unnamed protein product [Vitrella brassicaformis CCMP3155]